MYSYRGGASFQLGFGQTRARGDNREVEFITVAEWSHELNLLVGECSTHEEKTIYARPPEEQRQSDAAAAWTKVNQVYGHGTMEKYHGKPMVSVYDRLVQDRRVKDLLTPEIGGKARYDYIIVEEGCVEAAKAKELLVDFNSMNTRLRRSKKNWAHVFRGKINDYVYRKGNGNEPQTWPLIRKVVLHGPWPVLSTGACLVDLPGVRDANQAQAKVSEHYLQYCDQIWVVAPIKRAVDDGTAKELLGEQFKRRLLMDGQYGNVPFICTQTDDCEATEIMRDHQDVAMNKPGHWERMTELLTKITKLEMERTDLLQQEEDLKADFEDAEQALESSKEVLVEVRKKADDEHDDFEVDVELLEELKKSVEENSKGASQALLQLSFWRQENKWGLERTKETCRNFQRILKSICATVRNEYSKACLQEGFRTGLKEMTRKPEDEDETGTGNNDAVASPLPENFEMDVYCISANDYLKVQRIKPSSDGPPNTFSRSDDTQIPVLRGFVHETTAKYRATFTKNFVNTTSDMLDRVKLYAADAKDDPSGLSSRNYKALFKREMQVLQQKMLPIASEFRSKAEGKVNSALQPSLRSGTAKGHAAAISTVNSWGLKSRRNRHERGPGQNGLYWSTYQATVRRDGVYVSGSASAIDFNQELCDPMEEEFSFDWQRILDTSMKTILAECETEVLALSATVGKALLCGFADAGMTHERLQPMANAVSRSSATALKISFRAMKEIASSYQRDFNRSLLSLVQQRMKQGYEETQRVQHRAGRYARVKHALEGHSRDAVTSMFGDSTVELFKGVAQIIERLVGMVVATVQVISKNFETVYSVLLDDQSTKTGMVNTEQQENMRKCRDTVLSNLSRLRQIQDSVMDTLGIDREELELDVLGVDSWEDKQAKNLEEAKAAGEFFDLSNDSSDDEGPAPVQRSIKVKRKKKKFESEPDEVISSLSLCRPTASHNTNSHI